MRQRGRCTIQPHVLRCVGPGARKLRPTQAFFPTRDRRRKRRLRVTVEILCDVSSLATADILNGSLMHECAASRPKR